jgi:hypothetical protein
MTLDPEDAKKYILAASAAAGGVAIAAAAIAAKKHGWMEEDVSDDQSTGEVYGTVAAVATGMYLGGEMLREAIEEFGGKSVAIATVGVPVVAVLLRALRR